MGIFKYQNKTPQIIFMEIQQTKQYRIYLENINWKTIKVDNVNIYLKKIPFSFNIAKIQRSDILPKTQNLIDILKLNKIKLVAIEPTEKINQIDLDKLTEKLKKSKFIINKSPFLSTKTIIIDLSKTEDEIFTNFSQAKRRAIRKAVKNNVTVVESESISQLIKIKNKSAGFAGFITTWGQDKLWDSFAPDNAKILLSYSKNNELIAGVLLLFDDNQTSNYWIAGSTKKGKKLAAPSLIVWEALKISKRNGAAKFDFQGIWDERLPHLNNKWHGFSKFKKGFGGEEKYYPFTK